MHIAQKENSQSKRKSCKRTHTRFYTQSTAIDDKMLEFKEYSKQIKENVDQKNLRKYNLISLNRFSGSKQTKQNGINKIKKFSTNQKSIFNEISLFSPKLKKNNTDIQKYHPLKEYVNSLSERFRFTKINVPNVNSKKQKQIVYKQEPRNQNITFQHPDYQKCKSLIDQIFKQIQRFREAGFSDKKLNEWILKYCFMKRKYMINLLMKPFNKRKFHNKVDYFFEKKLNKVKQKLAQVKKVINGVQKHIDEYDLRQFLDYMEEILIQKSNVKVNELKNSIQQKLQECFIYNRQENQNRFKKRKQNGQVTNFITDLNNIEDQFGKFNNISNLNRSYFNMLGTAERNLRAKVNDLVNITQNKKILIFDTLNSQN